MNSPADRIRLWTWGLGQLARRGRPDLSLGFLGGIGDDLLCTAPIAEALGRGAGKIWFFTRHPDLYPLMDRRVQLLPEDPRLLHLARRIGRPMRPMDYWSYDPAADRYTPLSRHLIAEMCGRAGISGRVRLRPHLALSPAEKAAGARWNEVIAIQSSALGARRPIGNKEWHVQRWQEVIDRFRGKHRFVQIGSADNPPLPGAEDLRGRLRLRETAVLLAGARAFAGQEGFLMHLARAVECPALIVYGGWVPPSVTGYGCNANLAGQPPCSPCYQGSRCDFGHVCMEEISAGRVGDALESLLARPRGPLAEEHADL